MSKAAIKTKWRGDLIYRFGGAVVWLLAMFSSVTSFARNKYLVDCANSSGNIWYYYNADGTATTVEAINRDSDIDLEIVRMSNNNKAYTGTGAKVADLINSDDKVLECACGTGAISVFIAAKCRELTANDFSVGMIKQTMKKCRKYKTV